MPYDSVYSEKRPPGTLRRGANFIVTPCDGRPVRLRGAGCTVFLAAGLRLRHRQQFRLSIIAAVMVALWRSFSSGTDDLGRDVCRLLSGGASRKWRICGDACRDDLWLVLGTSPATRPAQRC